MASSVVWTRGDTQLMGLKLKVTSLEPHYARITNTSYISELMKRQRAIIKILNKKSNKK
jgi:hypothetical protein